MTYWDYIQTDALLNIQTQGQHFQMKWFYHVSSVNELIFKMILWEMKQIYCENIETVFFTERLMRISRYFDMLTTSFSIMEDGMEINT
jgi:tryptophan 2,3-dioxygenase